jgi:hypothetical protein
MTSGARNLGPFDPYDGHSSLMCWNGNGNGNVCKSMYKQWVVYVVCARRAGVGGCWGAGRSVW